MQSKKKTIKNRLTFVSMFSSLALMLTGCTSSDPESFGELSRQNCIGLLAEEIYCQDGMYSSGAPRTHPEYFEQLLPIHKRSNILEIESEDFNRGR